MKVKFNEYLERTILVNKAETRELERNGSIYDAEHEILIVKVNGNYVVAKPVEEDEIKFNQEEA